MADFQTAARVGSLKPSRWHAALSAGVHHSRPGDLQQPRGHHRAAPQRSDGAGARRDPGGSALRHPVASGPGRSGTPLTRLAGPTQASATQSPFALPDLHRGERGLPGVCGQRYGFPEEERDSIQTAVLQVKRGEKRKTSLMFQHQTFNICSDPPKQEDSQRLVVRHSRRASHRGGEI